MSVDLFVFLDRSRLPATGQWQTVLDRLGVDVQLDEAIDATNHAGFWPARSHGASSGFEYYAGPIRDAFGREAPTGLGDRDYAVNFVIHSDMRELRCAMFAAAALALDADGLVFDEETGGLISGATLLDQAQSMPST